MPRGSRRGGAVAATGRRGKGRNVKLSGKGERPLTRSSRSRLVDDPEQMEAQLTAQLSAMSLYASQTTGDGNCLFRALSDQFYGSPNHHARLRQEICDYLEASPDRFAGFVDIEKPFDEYVKTMRQNGTYGGHLELSAFASLKRKEIKIVQPGLVYVVTGDDDSSEAAAERQALERQRQQIQSTLPPGAEGPPPTSREMRRQRRINSRSVSKGLVEEPSSSTRNNTPVTGEAEAGPSHTSSQPSAPGEGATPVPPAGPIEAFGPLYIAYHNYEHYSSVRNLAGPHSGLPRIIERNVSQAASQDTSSIKGKGRHSDDDDNDDGFALGGSGDEGGDGTASKPTECEELILRSVPGHTLSEVRFLLKQHGNLWETVVEVLIAKDAADAGAGDESGGGQAGLSSSPNGTRMLRSTRNTAFQSPPSPSSPHRLHARPVDARTGDCVSAIPSPVLGGYDGDGEGSRPSSAGIASATPDLRDDQSGSSSHASGSKKRSASKGPLILDEDRQYLTKRSRSRSGSGSGSGSGSRSRSQSAQTGDIGPSNSGGSGSRAGSQATDEREARSVDGALVADTSQAANGVPSQEDDAMSCSMTTIGLSGTETPGPASASSSESPLPPSAPIAGPSSAATPPVSAHPATSSKLPPGVVLPTHTRRGRELSPPLSPTLVASMLGSSGSRGGRTRGKAKSAEGVIDSEDGGGGGAADSSYGASPEADGASASASGLSLTALSPKERRDLELKRKRDRQRERRALARRQKELKDEAIAAAKSARAGAGSVGKAPSSVPVPVLAPEAEGGKAAGRGKEKEKRGARAAAAAAASKREERAAAKGKGKGGNAAASAGGGGGNVLPPKGFVELKI